MGSSLDPRRMPVAIALGSNLGDRGLHLNAAVTALAVHLDSLKVSSFHDTAPIGVGSQPRFLNAAVIGRSTLAADVLLGELLGIEAGLGRTRPFPGAPRTVDLDLILYGDAVINSQRLTVPHPRFRDRLFVLAPLAEIAGEWRDPVTGLTVETLLTRLQAAPHEGPQ
jgi:2-amino-4-hydroxy-6-hydroxymethyldihydropteridine diphosphokinase